MRSVSVVVAPPFFDAGACVAHGKEPGGVEAFLAQSAVEGEEGLEIDPVDRFPRRKM